MALIQVVPKQNGWAVLEDGSEVNTFSTQEEAGETGRSRAREVDAEFQLHGEDGRIREKDSFGSDPRDIPG